MKVLRENSFSKLGNSISNIHLNIPIKDKIYQKFIEAFNGGLFFEGALVLYGFNTNIFDFYSVNKIVNENYDIKGGKDVWFIGQDIFCNQLCYQEGKGFFMLFIESGQREYIANNFSLFLEALKIDGDYLCGITFLRDWLNNSKEEHLKIRERLCPIKPFVIGGDYVVSNFRKDEFQNILKYNAEIYKKIKNLPDGSNFRVEPE